MRGETKSFPIGVMLTITTGRMLISSRGPNGIAHEIPLCVGWTMGDEGVNDSGAAFLRTACAAALLRRFPELIVANRKESELDCALKAVRGLREDRILAVINEWMVTLNLQATYDIPFGCSADGLE